jgi:hypothetical protein
MFLWSKARPVCKAQSYREFVSRLPRQCGILNMPQLRRPPWPVTGIVLLYFALLYFTAKDIVLTKEYLFETSVYKCTML